LTRHYQPALGGSVLRLMEVVGAEAEFAAHAAREWLEGGRTPNYEYLPLAVQRRLIHQQLTAHKLAPDFDLIERLRLSSGQLIAVSTDCSVFRDAAGVIHLRKPELVRFSSKRRVFPFSAKRGEIAFGGLMIQWQITDDNGMITAGKGADIEYFDADKVGTPVCLRCWQPGDRFQPIGTGSARKLQDLFTNLKVPRGERRSRVVAATRRGELFWVEGLRMAEKFKLDENTARKLKWCWRRNSGAE